MLLLVVVLGMTCRIVQFAWKTSLWHDEALVTLNVMHRSYGQLLRPLDYEQAAPPLFLFAQRWMLLHFGFGEYPLRVMSLVCGVLSVPLFAWLAWRLFPAAVAVWTAALFAFCDKLIWHSAQAKQYEGDVLAALVLLFVAIGLRHPRTSALRVAVLSLLASVLLWFSFPAVFVFGAVALMLLPRVWRQARLPGLMVALTSMLLPIASFAVLYALTVRGHASYLDQYWSAHLADWHKAWLVPWWVIREVYSLCDHPFRSFGWLVLPLTLSGAVYLYRRDRQDVMLSCVGPIALCLVAALIDKYPFTGERITIFLVPALLLLMAAGLEGLRGLFPRFWFLAVLPLAVQAGGQAAYHLGHPHCRSAMRPIAQYLREHRQSDEAICLVGEGTSPNSHFTSGRNLELLCYWPNVPGPLYGYPPEYPRLHDVHQIHEKRFWIVFAALPEHGSRYMAGLLNDARSIADEIDGKELSGGGAILFEKR